MQKGNDMNKEIAAIDIYNIYRNCLNIDDFFKLKKRTNNSFNKTKYIFNGKINVGFNKPAVVGYISDFANKNKIKSGKELVIKYFNTNYKLTTKEFLNLCATFKKALKEKENIDISINEAIGLLVEFIFINTTLGIFAEKRTVNYINKQIKEYNLTCGKAEKELDVVYGADLIIKQEEDNRIICGVQVKPDTANNSKILACNEQIDLTHQKNKDLSFPVLWFFYKRTNDKLYLDREQTKIFLRDLKAILSQL